MVKIPLPAGSYPTDEHEIMSFRHWPGRKINRYGLHFDGVDDYVDCGNDASLNMTKEVTVIALANAFTVRDKDTRIVSKGGWATNYDLYWHRNAFWVFDAKFSDGNNYNISSAGHTELNTLNIPHFLAGVVKDAEMDLIVDTTKITRAIPSGLNLITNDKPVKIGAWPASFNGNIYFVALYNRALSDAEISQMYDYVVNDEGYLILDGLVLLLDFTEYGSNILYDKSGNNNHGTIYGATWLDGSSGKVDAFVPVVEG